MEVAVTVLFLYEREEKNNTTLNFQWRSYGQCKHAESHTVEYE